MQNDSAVGGVFFGREKISALLEKRLEAFEKGYRQNIGVIGPPFAGKTSLIHIFLKDVSRLNIIPVLISCQEFDSFERFSEKWMGEILFGFHQAFQRPIPANFQELLRGLKGALPKVLARMRSVKKLILKRRYDQAFQDLLTLSGLLHEESGKKVLMVLDDFDRFGDMNLNDPFGSFGKEIMIQKETMFFVTSSRQLQSASIFREKLSLLFGNFEVIKLRPFDFEESKKFIEVGLGEIILDDNLTRFLIRLTDGRPYYLNLILNRLRFEEKYSLASKRELLIQTLTIELFERNGALYQYFRSCLYQMSQGRPWPYYADVLVAIALGHKKFYQIARFLKQKTNDIKKILERLMQFEMIEKHSAIFQIPDPLFRFWLAHVYYRERFLFERSVSAGLGGFRSDAGKAIEEDVIADSHELPKRIEELFLKFRNDAVLLNGRRFKCPHFTEVTTKPNNGRVFPLVAKSSQIRWLCQVLSSPGTEEDIRTFLEDAGRFKGVIYKRLVVALKGIDLNAKLLAQEAKIQYLDLRDLNFLFDLYDKPKVVL